MSHESDQPAAGELAALRRAARRARVEAFRGGGSVSYLRDGQLVSVEGLQLLAELSEADQAALLSGRPVPEL